MIYIVGTIGAYVATKKNDWFSFKEKKNHEFKSGVWNTDFEY